MATMDALRAYLNTPGPPEYRSPGGDAMAIALAIRDMFGSPRGDQVKVSTQWAPSA